MKNEFSQLIPGATTSEGELEVTSPFTLEKIGAVQFSDAEGVEVALSAAEKLFHDPARAIPAWERIEILDKMARALAERSEEIAMGAAMEGGKPLVDSRVEVDRAVDGIRSCIEVLRTQSGSEIPMNLNPSSAGRLAVTRHEPIGPVLAFSAFNHPVNLIVHQVMPAVAVGCPVIVKPASDTPLSCFRLVEMLHEAGLPPEWCQALVLKDRDAMTKMVEDRRIAFFSFIGSAKVGWMLKSKLSPGTHCALEHGGVAPVIVAADADLDKAIPKLAKAGLYHAGQVCVSVQRIYVNSSRAEELIERLRDAANEMKVGDPVDGETEVGPLIREKELDRIHEWVQEAVSAGAELVCGGKPHQVAEQVCYEPTVLVNPPEDVTISQDEVFGPVVCVYTYDEVEDAIGRANALPYSFQAAVFTGSIDLMMRCYRELNAMTVMANDHTAFRVDWMPFGGHKESGYGTGGIPFTMEDMQIRKQLVINSA